MASKIPANIKKQMQKALVKTTDMTMELEAEVVDIIVGVIDKQTGPEGTRSTTTEVENGVYYTSTRNVLSIYSRRCEKKALMMV